MPQGAPAASKSKTRTRILASARALLAGGCQLSMMSSSASGAAYAPVRVRDTVEEVAGIVVGL